MERLPHFMKHYMTEADLMVLLKSRGLVISDEAKAVRYLESIGYYRLSAYMYPFLKVPKETHQYKDGTTFQQVLNLYRFDKKLRMLLLYEIEKEEIAIRRAIMNIPVQMTGDTYWLTNSVHFANQRTFQETKNTIDREYTKSTEEFIKHFKNSYCDPYPPSWILGELLTMGNVNMIDTQAYLSLFRLATYRLGILDNIFDFVAKCLLSSFKGVEQGKFHYACYSKKNYSSMDYPAGKPSKSVFHNLYHQVFP